MYFHNPFCSPTSLFFPFPFSFAADAQKCELICQSEGTGDVVFMNQVVHDGTRCSYRDPYSICVRGECVVRSCCGTVPVLSVPRRELSPLGTGALPLGTEPMCSKGDGRAMGWASGL